MRLGVSLCVPHKCRCGAEVDAQARHAMVCRKAPGRIARHHVMNDIVWRALNSAGVPSTKEPTGLCRHDGKRSDGLSLIKWQNGKPLVWDVTVVSTLADSYVAVAVYESLVWSRSQLLRGNRSNILTFNRSYRTTSSSR